MFYAVLAILQNANPVVVEIPKESKAGKFLNCEICLLLGMVTTLSILEIIIDSVICAGRRERYSLQSCSTRKSGEKY